MADTSAGTPSLPRRLGAEAIGTFWLVLAGCGTAVLAAGFPNSGVGFLGVALAFGLAVLTMAYAVGHVSGGHFNPAVTLGLAVAKRFEWRDVAPYIVTQVVAATVGATVLFVIANGQKGFSAHASGFAANGYGDHSPGQVRAAGLSGLRDRDDRDLRLRHPRRDRQAGSRRLRPDRDRLGRSPRSTWSRSR